MKNIPHQIFPLTLFSVIIQYKAMLPQIMIGKLKLMHAIMEYVFFFFLIEVISFNLGWFLIFISISLIISSKLKLFG